MNKRLDEISREVLQIDTLETQGVDRLDFHHIAVWQLKEALDQAYAAGMLDCDCDRTHD